MSQYSFFYVSIFHVIKKFFYNILEYVKWKGPNRKLYVQ